MAGVLPFFVGLLGLAGTTWILFNDYRIPVTIILLILALVCLGIGIFAYIYDIKDGCRKDKERKRNEVREALREAVKRLSPEGTEYTEEQLDTWMKGI
ncbi:hypothetical protein ACFLUS_04705 [Chloroflexota bacterium]